MRALWLVLSVSFRVSVWQSLLCLCEAAGKALMAASPLFLGWLAAGAIQQDLSQLIVAAAALVGSTALNMALQAIGTHARIVQVERVGFAFDIEVAHITAKIETLDHLESAHYLDQLQILRDNENALGMAFNSAVNTVNNFAFGIGTVAVALTADWRLLLIAVLGVPRIVASRWTVRWGRESEEAAAAPSRLTNHLLDLTTDVAAGSELRVFGLQRELRGRLGESVRCWRAPSVRLSGRYAVLDGANSVLFFGGSAVVLGWLTHGALHGSVSVQALVVGVSAVGGLQNLSGIVIGAVQMLSRTIRNANRFRWLRDYAAQVAEAHSGTTQPPTRLARGIRIEQLSYRYGDSERDSLTDVTLDLPAGSIVALVGENGAGKSTLVKLLAGMYRPTNGRILIDGTDLTDLDLDQWRERMSGAFQDYAAFEFAALESVGVGDVNHLNATTVRRALHDAAASDVLGALPRGLDTQLGTTWPGGVDISGGQWQRLAIGRGMMRQHPLLLVLDEPTSALDAATEHALFEQYASAAREAGRRGAVTLLVTHRFSTVSAADLVVVLDGGRVVEVGSHTELINHGGHYAELYELQARGYR